MGEAISPGVECDGEIFQMDLSALLESLGDG